jgi:hypothetical protein
MLKSAGNVRAARRLTLLVLDLDTGDAVELQGIGSYRTVRTAKQARTAGLEQHPEPFPVQGEMTVSITRTLRLEQLTWPRRRLEKAVRFTSASSLDLQAPQ